MQRLSILILLLLFIPRLSLAQVYWAEHMNSKGEVAIESRVFDRDSRPETPDWGVSFFSRVETRYDTREFSHVFRGMARIDRKDEGRNFITIEDAYFSARLFSGQVKLLGGYKIFNWTATEAFHPADQINSRNYDGELENLEKKGELTIELEVPVWNGVVSFLLLPRFEEPKLPGANSRQGGTGITLDRPVVVDGEDATTNDPWVWQFGINTIQSFSFGDVSFHALRHVNRNYPLLGTHDFGTRTFTIPFPPISFEQLLPNSTVVRPYYFKTTQIGGTVQWMLPVVTKIEWAYRWFERDRDIMDLSFVNEVTLNGYPAESLRRPVNHGEVALGFEYPYDHESGTESMFLLEFNTFLGTSKEERQRLSIFQRDMFLGYRFSLNDFMGREFLLSSIIDLEGRSEQLYSLSYSQRLSDFWRIRTGLRIYQAKRPVDRLRTSGMQLLRRSDSFNLTLTRYF
jgi:hypothetical protein